MARNAKIREGVALSRSGLWRPNEVLCECWMENLVGSSTAQRQKPRRQNGCASPVFIQQQQTTRPVPRFKWHSNVPTFPLTARALWIKLSWGFGHSFFCSFNFVQFFLMVWLVQCLSKKSLNPDCLCFILIFDKTLKTRLSPAQVLHVVRLTSAWCANSGRRHPSLCSLFTPQATNTFEFTLLKNTLFKNTLVKNTLFKNTLVKNTLLRKYPFKKWCVSNGPSPLSLFSLLHLIQPSM